MRRPLNSLAESIHPYQPEHPVKLNANLVECADGERPIWRRLQELLDEAHTQHAYQIHIEPGKDCWRIRLKSAFNFTETRGESIEDYQKLLVELREKLWPLNDTKTPLRGWFEFPVNQVDWLLQIDIVPSSQGDTFMLTLLRPSRSPPPRLESLALSRKQHATIRSILHEKKGLVLLASDLEIPRLKTARALTQELVAPDRKIVCADRPGHPVLPRTTQLTVDTPPTEDQQATWSAMCELGCDVIIACQPLNDHLDHQLVRYASKDTLVIQGVEAGNATDALTRMLSCGIRSEALARTLSAIIVQRQVQCICRYCRQSQVPDDESTAWLAEHNPIRAGNINDWLRHRMRSSFSQAEGCSKCRETGRGEILDIFDIIMIDDAVRDALYDADIRYAMSLLQEHTALSTHLLNLAQEGIISLAEAVRVAPLSASND